jgi:acetyl-CoA/propionyl-CoA carboxylase biotin carboxyl carrier protein
MLACEPPSGPGVRVDAGFEEGSTVGLDYDPLLAKLVVSGPDRGSCLSRARRALADWIVLGVETNAPLLAAVLASEEFASGRYATDLVSRLPALPPSAPSDGAWIAAALTLSESKPGARVAALAEPWGAANGWRAGG